MSSRAMRWGFESLVNHQPVEACAGVVETARNAVQTVYIYISVVATSSGQQKGVMIYQQRTS
jgi:hypothetical protein